jgi:hypothetical protein
MLAKKQLFELFPENGAQLVSRVMADGSVVLF